MSKTLRPAAPDASRRRFHAGVAGALLGAAAAHPSATAAASAPRPAGTAAYGVPRGRFGLSADFHLGRANRVLLVPFDRTVFSESSDWVLQPDGMLRIQTTGLYRVSMCLDWVAQQGSDIDLRLFGIRRKRVGAPGGPSLKDDRLASADLPGSDVPKLARYQGVWSPGRVARGGLTGVEVAVSPPGSVGLGDAVVVSHTGLDDARLPPGAADALSLRGRVVAPDRVRVVLQNTALDQDLDVPAGDLRVLAMNLVDTRGESADAWQMVHTTLEELRAGELVYAVARNKSIATDYIQATDTSFLHIERHG